MTTLSKPRVLLTNDDGPPDPNYSPYVLGLFFHLTTRLGWQVKVVLPSSQKSWIGKAYHIKDIIQGNYFYPKEDGTGNISPTPRPLNEEELGEWILLDGTPATCANIALHNIYPEEIDLVISGPNFGRNTSAAFALSSGTVGAAMSSSLSKKRAIALSYGTVVHPTPTTYSDAAHELSCRIVSHLWHNWGPDDFGLRHGEVDLYSVNIPLIEELLAEGSLKIYWTTLWRNSYRRLFENISGSKPDYRTIMLPGPDASTEVSLAEGRESKVSKNVEASPLTFKWSPDIDDVINPTVDRLPLGSDAWAIHNGCASVTPLRASFAESYCEGADANLGTEWKINS